MSRDATEISRRKWRIGIGIAFMLLTSFFLLLGSGNSNSPGYIKIKLEGFRTNAADEAETLLTFQNEADDIRIEPHVNFAADGKYEPFSTLAVQDAQGAWITTFMHGGSNMIFMAKFWTNSNFEIRSSAGMELSKGMETRLTFPKPTNSFNVVIDCWRKKPPTRSKLFQQTARVNQWLSSKWGFPVIISESYWTHFQATLPAIPAVGLEVDPVPSTFLNEREFRP